MVDSNLTNVLIQAFLFKMVGGLGIFLLGMKNMSEGMQAVAGNRLRTLIGAATNNRIVACLVGILITCVIQSSSVTTVMVVGFVNGGFMTLMQALGVILGANIGTTITGWLLQMPIGKYGLPLLGIASFVYLFSRKEWARYGAMAIMGIGMVFFGLETMSSGFKDPQVYDLLTSVFARMNAGTFGGVLMCAFVGCTATAIVQSSSATLGITIALASSGIVNFPTAAALIFGLNVGTTITAFLASLGSTTSARRAAYAHILFNIVGTVWLFPIFYPYVAAVERIVGAMGGGENPTSAIVAKIALAHTTFNIVNTLVFLPLMGVLVRIVTRMVPDKPHKEIPHLTFLDVRMLDVPSIGIQQSLDEIIRMGNHTQKMLGLLRELIDTEDIDEDKVRKVFHREEIMDVVQKEVVEFLSHILSGTIPQDVVAAGRMQLRVADEYESVSDYVANILKLRMKLHNANLQISKDGTDDILNLHDKVSAYVDTISDALRSNNTDILSRARTDGDAITLHMKDLRSRHFDRVKSKNVSPFKSMTYIDILSAYRKIKDHTLNIAEALVGEK
ncbi:MAG: Na/Pi cotransporter family protein [Planctomycetes bacterium]|nr:Na/Pi cotransporter family protein [Planctomycetota bacterium]